MENATGEVRWAHYDLFRVSDSSDNYRLQTDGYDPLSSLGDSLSFHSGIQFSTIDLDNDSAGTNCAQTSASGFWFDSCYSTNPLGRYD